MSKYFYLVNKYNHNVLEIPGSVKDRNLCATQLRVGALNQLWKWDSMAWLVSKTGFVADIKSKSKKKEAIVLSWSAHDGLNQQWRVEEGVIKSNMNNLAIGLDKNNNARMYAPNVYDNSQHWEFVPEECIEYYEYVLENPNPFNEAIFCKKVADDYLHAIIGYDIKDYKEAILNTCQLILDCANQLDKVAFDTGITETTGGVAGVIGGALVLAGVFLAPPTGGMSVGLTMGGAGLAALGGGTSLTGNIISKVWDSKESK